MAVHAPGNGLLMRLSPSRTGTRASARDLLPLFFCFVVLFSRIVLFYFSRFTVLARFRFLMISSATQDLAGKVKLECMTKKKSFLYDLLKETEL